MVRKRVVLAAGLGTAVLCFTVRAIICRRPRASSAIASLDAARALADATIVLRGGGDEQIYLTVPAKYAACDEATLRALGAELDRAVAGDGTRARLTFEIVPVGSWIAGACGGGSVIDGVWVHPSLDAGGIRAGAAAIIFGRHGGTVNIVIDGLRADE